MLHISDLHLGVVARKKSVTDAWEGWSGLQAQANAITSGHQSVFDLSTHNEDALDLLADVINGRHDEFDAVLFTGDLACCGSAHDLAVAQWFFDVRLSQDPALRRKICIVPGNHDTLFHYHRWPCIEVGNDRFYRVFANYWPHGARARTLLDIGPADGRLAILGADLTLPRNDRSCRSEPPPFNTGYGRLHSRHLAELVTLTRGVGARRPGTTVLWAIHFEPSPTRYPALQLLDDADLLSVAAAEGVSAILCGHTHWGAARTTTTPPVLVCGTSSQFHTMPDNQSPAGKAGNEYRILEFVIDPKRKKMQGWTYDGWSRPENAPRTKFFER